MDGHQTIRESIITDMSEGVMAIRYNGVIELANDAALAVSFLQTIKRFNLAQGRLLT